MLCSILQGAPSIQLKRVGLNPEACSALDLVEQILRQFNVNILDTTGIKAGEVAMGITAIAVKTAIGLIQTLDAQRTEEPRGSDKPRYDQYCAHVCSIVRKYLLH